MTNINAEQLEAIEAAGRKKHVALIKRLNKTNPEQAEALKALDLALRKIQKVNIPIICWALFPNGEEVADSWFFKNLYSENFDLNDKKSHISVMAHVTTWARTFFLEMVGFLGDVPGFKINIVDQVSKKKFKNYEDKNNETEE